MVDFFKFTVLIIWENVWLYVWYILPYEFTIKTKKQFVSR